MERPHDPSINGAHDRVIACMNRPDATPDDGDGEQACRSRPLLRRQGLDHAARSSRPFGGSLVVLREEPASEIFMAMQGDTPREALHPLHGRRRLH
jgi:hypothetical protein